MLQQLACTNCAWVFALLLRGAGTAEATMGDMCHLLTRVASHGVHILSVNGGDLAGWLGDLAPKGDLDSAQLFYRMCCLFETPSSWASLLVDTRLEGMLSMNTVHAKLLPLLALAYQVPAPVASSPAPTAASSDGSAQLQTSDDRSSSTSASGSKHGQQQQQQQTGSNYSSNPAPGSAHRQQQRQQQQQLLHDRLVSALSSSPATLGSLAMAGEEGGMLVEGMVKKVLGLVQVRLELPQGSHL
jgi:hypothetical protein